MKHVALLRGINVGGKNMLPMKELCALFAAVGCAHVESYIQSGNVIFEAPVRTLAALPARVSAAIEARFGFAPPVVVRSARELAAVIAHVPYRDTEHVHVAFLAASPARARVAALDPDVARPEHFTLRGRDLYVYLPNGAGRAKLGTTYFDKQLATTTTLRNWRTVLELGVRLTAA